MQILNGRWGAYIAYNGKNYKMSKAMQNNVEALTLEECMKVVENEGKKSYRGTKK